MFFLTPQERKFVCLVMIVFIIGAAVQLSLRRDIAPMRWAKSVRHFKIHINTAHDYELQMLPGIGAKLAQRIVEYRHAHASFKTVEDLKYVHGLTAKRFEHIKGLIEL
jgi:competence ComEA-like helix-hairpin-helix protein